jgi:hypothetical protein
MYKEFSRFKTNILENSPKLANIGIRNFFVVDGFREKSGTYRNEGSGEKTFNYHIYVLLGNNSILKYYSQQETQEKLKNEPTFRSLGIFDNNPSPSNKKLQTGN